MDYFAEKINVVHAKAEEISFTFEDANELNKEEISKPLRGILNGLILSLPIWGVGYLIFKLF